MFLSAALPVALAGCMAAIPPEQGPALTSLDAYEMNRAGRLLIVDLRPDEERARDGAPAAAASVAFPVGALADHQPFIEGVDRAVASDRTRALALLCRRGVTSRAAQIVLANAGFSSVYNVSDGFLGNETGPGWKAWGLPVAFPSGIQAADDRPR